MEQTVWVVDRPDGEFRRVKVHVPELAASQVRVRISASCVNPIDTKIRTGKTAVAKQPFPAVLGVDMAGTIVQVGHGVTTFKPGDEVYGLAGGAGGLQGTLAELIAVDADLLAHKPKSLSMREAAALPLSVITAWEGLVDRANVGPGQRVLIHAGAGGVGHIAVQLARAFGAEVFTTVSLDKRRIAEEFGAFPIDYRSVSVEDYVTACTNGKGFDIVYDTVGDGTLDASFEAVKRHTGCVVSCMGWGSHSLAPLSFRGATYSGVFTLLPLITGEGRAHHGEILERAAELAEAGKLKPLLNQHRFSKGDIEAAHALVASGAVGKVVVEIDR